MDAKCYYHSTEKALERCHKCGKPLCRKCAKKMRENVLFLIWLDRAYCPACYEKEMQKKVKQWRTDMGWSEKDYSQKKDDEFLY